MKLVLGFLALLVALCLASNVFASCSKSVCPTCPCPDCKVITVVKEVPGGNTVQLVPTEVPVTDVQVVTSEVPVDRVVQVTKEVPGGNTVQLVPTEVPVTDVQVVTSEVPVDRVVQVTKEVPVEKIVYKDRVISSPGSSNNGETKWVGLRTGLDIKNTVGKGENILELVYTACDVVETDCVTGFGTKIQWVYLWLNNTGPDDVLAGGLLFAVGDQSLSTPNGLVIYSDGTYPLGLMEMRAGEVPLLVRGAVDKTAQLRISSFTGDNSTAVSAAELRLNGGWIIVPPAEEVPPDGASMLSANDRLAQLGRA